MNKIIILGILGVIVVAGVLLALNYAPEQEPVALGEEIILVPWVEVLSPSVFELQGEDSSLLRALQTGDEPGIGNVISVKENGLANVYFPDGSVARLDSATQLIIETARFDPERETLVVKIKLSAGRVWSKILALATPESLWEVETTNIIATVRGTAFGVEHKEGKSSVVGSENELAVYLVDPETQKAVEETRVVISPDKFIEVKEEEVTAIKEKPKMLAQALRDAPEAVLEEDWVKRGKAEDVKFEEKLNDLRRPEIKEKDLREEFREAIYKQFNKELKRPKSKEESQGRAIIDKFAEKESESSEARFKAEIGQSLEQETKEEDAGELTKPKEFVEEETGKSKEKPSPVVKKEESGLAVIEPEKLSLRTKNDLSDLSHMIEGDRIVFEAVLKMNDGSYRDISDRVEWRVLGGIGRMEKPGVFVAKLDVSVVELGESFGTIIAIWKDAEGRAALLGESPIINVRAKVEETTDERG